MAATKDSATKTDIARLENLILDSRNGTLTARYNAMYGFAAVSATVVIGAVSVAVMFLK